MTTNQDIKLDALENSNDDIFNIRNLKTYFPVGKGQFVRAVDDVSLTIKKGEVMGLVGESGSGKSTIAYTLMGMYKEKEGDIYFEGKKINSKKNQRDNDFKKRVQIVFQDPGSSLNPYQDVREILSLPLRVHNKLSREQIEKKILEILKLVELPESFMFKVPSAIGGGEKQLVSIARALCCDPSFIILDEPTSALDVSIQAKIINMLLKLHKEQELTYMLITHDMGLMRNISTRVAIMYLGKICEIAPTELFYQNPLHPYTNMLLSSIPVVSEEEEALKPHRIVSQGEIPSPVNIPSGCTFHTRCPQKMDICSRQMPELQEVGPDHLVRCHLCQNSN